MAIQLARPFGNSFVNLELRVEPCQPVPYLEPLQRTRLIVFVRAPRPGSVKTRLAAEIGADDACAAYRQMMDTLMPHLQSPAFFVELRYTPDNAAGELAPWIAPGWEVVPQGDGDLGERLHRAAVASEAAGFNRTLLIGSDCPYLNEADLQEASNGLSQHDVVIGPAMDGGYWLIGMKRAFECLFENIPWSSANVLDITLERASAAGLSAGLLRPLRDVDTSEDWEAFLQWRDRQPCATRKA